MLGNEYLRQVWVHVVATAAFPFFLAQKITVKTTIFNHITVKRRGGVGGLSSKLQCQRFNSLGYNKFMKCPRRILTSNMTAFCLS